jgi:PDZ domain-containing secreted protein
MNYHSFNIELKDIKGTVEKREVKINIENNTSTDVAKSQLLQIAKQEGKELLGIEYMGMFAYNKPPQ